MIDNLDFDFDLETPAKTSEADFDLFALDEDIEYATKSEAIADIITAQDPDLTYVSKDGVKWEARLNQEDPKKSQWTNHNDLQYLNEYSILEALEIMIKADASLVAKIAENLL